MAQDAPLPPKPPADFRALTDLPQEPAACAGASDVAPDRLNCLGRGQAAAQHELKAALARARAALGHAPARRAVLDRTQAAWSRYVDARCGGEVPPIYAGGAGHGAEAATALCFTVHARRRTVELNGLVNAGA